jgi:hypothetical protein
VEKNAARANFFRRNARDIDGVTVCADSAARFCPDGTSGQRVEILPVLYRDREYVESLHESFAPEHLGNSVVESVERSRSRSTALAGHSGAFHLRVRRRDHPGKFLRGLPHGKLVSASSDETARPASVLRAMAR